MTLPTDEARREFPRTSLTLYQRIHSRSSSDSTEALNEFFSLYWLPLYSFLSKRYQGKIYDSWELIHLLRESGNSRLSRC